MVKLFVRAIGAATSVFQLISKLGKRLQPQRWISIAFVGLFLLTTSIDSSSLNQSTKDALNDLITRGDRNGRPVTTGQWQTENEKLQGQPGKQAKRIAKETGDAVQEMGEIYPDNIETLTPGVENRSLETDD